MNYLKAKAVIEFPPQPPDLNPTHYLSGDLKPDKTKHSWHEVLWSVVRSCERICAVGGKAVECKRINSLMNNKNSASLNDNNNNDQIQFLESRCFQKRSLTHGYAELEEEEQVKV